MPVSMHGKCCEAVRDKIRALDLAGILPANIRLLKLIKDRGDLVLPAVLLSHEGVETVEWATNGEDDIGYPVSLAIAVGEDQDLEHEDQPLLWRKQIRDAFHEKYLPSADPRAWRTLWEPLAIIDQNAFAQNLFVSAATIRVIVRELRPR